MGLHDDSLTGFNGLNTVTTLFVIFEIAKALRFIHQLYVVHLDVKPANILIAVDREELEAISLTNPTRTGIIKLGDFGISKKFDQGPVATCGTLSYMAPECFLSDSLATPCKADVWSLGVTACELLKGCYLFGTCDESEVMELIVGWGDPDGLTPFRGACHSL